MDTAYSVNGVPIRLTHERWFHIIENHDDLASYFYEVLDTIEKSKKYGKEAMVSCYCPTRGMGEKPSPLGEDFSMLAEWRSYR